MHLSIVYSFRHVHQAPAEGLLAREVVGTDVKLVKLTRWLLFSLPVCSQLPPALMIRACSFEVLGLTAYACFYSTLGGGAAGVALLISTSWPAWLWALPHKPPPRSPTTPPRPRRHWPPWIFASPAPFSSPSLSWPTPPPPWVTPWPCQRTRETPAFTSLPHRRYGKQKRGGCFQPRGKRLSFRARRFSHCSSH